MDSVQERDDADDLDDDDEDDECNAERYGGQKPSNIASSASNSQATVQDNSANAAGVQEAASEENPSTGQDKTDKPKQLENSEEGK